MFDWREVSEAWLRVVMVKVVAPRSDQITGLAQAVEQMYVQTLIAHPTVEAFDRTILHGFTGRDGMPVDFAVFPPF